VLPEGRRPGLACRGLRDCRWVSPRAAEDVIAPLGAGARAETRKRVHAGQLSTDRTSERLISHRPDAIRP
jgi:hypothetical protein